jgi:hypothetical protein
VRRWHVGFVSIFHLSLHNFLVRQKSRILMDHVRVCHSQPHLSVYRIVLSLPIHIPAISVSHSGQTWPIQMA